MRYTPAAIALSCVVALSASVVHTQTIDRLSPQAQALVQQGRFERAEGRYDKSIDLFEAALVLQPGSPQILIDLAQTNNAQGMTGKSLQYYRMALERDPRNLDAIAGEGVVLLEKGATDRAQQNLARLKSLCGASCPESDALAAQIAKGPSPRVLTAEAKPTETAPSSQ